MRYAARTDVPVDRSLNELRTLLARYGADRFAFADEPERATISFVMNGRGIRIRLPIPTLEECSKTDRGRARSKVAAAEERSQAIRSRWRSLVLTCKAKLEAVASGIMTFETEWLPYMMLPNGRTVAEIAGPEVAAAYSSGVAPERLLGMGGP